MGKPRKWTPERDAWLAARYADVPNGLLLDAFAAEFGWRPTMGSLVTRASALGLRKPRKEWTAEESEWFVAYVPGHTESEISAEHERLFGSPLSKSQIGNAKVRYGVRSGTVGGRFEKGRKWRGWASEEHKRNFLAASEHSRYRKGNMPHNATQPIGAASG